MLRRSLLGLVPAGLFSWCASFGRAAVPSRLIEQTLTPFDVARLEALLLPIFKQLPEAVRRKEWWNFFGPHQCEWRPEDRSVWRVLSAAGDDVPVHLRTVYVEHNRITNAKDLFNGIPWERAGQHWHMHGERRTVKAWCPATSPISQHCRYFHGEVIVEEHHWVADDGPLASTYLIRSTPETVVAELDSYANPSFNFGFRYDDEQAYNRIRYPKQGA